MGMKDLEHDGDEDFLEGDFPNGKKAAKILKEDEQTREEREEAELAKLQEEYMRLDNPDLWDGEI